MLSSKEQLSTILHIFRYENFMKKYAQNKWKHSTSGSLQSVTRHITWKYTRTTTPALLYREVTAVAEVHRLTGLLRLRIVTVLSSPRDQ